MHVLHACAAARTAGGSAGGRARRQRAESGEAGGLTLGCVALAAERALLHAQQGLVEARECGLR